MQVTELIYRHLQSENVDTIFSLGSTGILDLLSGIESRDEMEVVHTRHEEGAVTMADAYSRASGETGVCMVGMGPALAHTGTGLVTARKHGSNLLVVVPEASNSFSSYYPKKRFEGYYEKTFEQEQYLDSTVGNVVAIRSPDAVVPKLRDSFRQLRTGNGPVAVQIPMDLFRKEANGGFNQETARSATPYDGPATRLQPDNELVEAAVDRYLDSDATKVPVILAGAGVVRADARGAVDNLAERINGVIATTLKARGYFDDHPFSIGLVGSYGNNLANSKIAESDFVLAVGCSLNVRTTDSGYLLNDDAKIVQVDADPAAIERFEPIDVGIAGDARATLNAFREALEQAGIDREGQFWTDRLQREIAESAPWPQTDYPEISRTMDPREVVAYLESVLPANRQVVMDGGYQANWVAQGISTPEPGDFITPNDFASVGLSLYAGTGAAMSPDQKRTFVFSGDAAFLMGIQELDTLVRHDIPITIVVMNDEALASEFHTLEDSGRFADMSLVDSPDIGKIAEAYGAEGHTVESMDELRELEGLITDGPAGPLVLNCRINRNVRK